MTQTKLGSFAESCANIAVGFSINFVANLVILPWFGYDVTTGDAFGMGLIFTVISLVRSYVLRRWFNGLKFGNKPRPVSVEEAGRRAMQREALRNYRAGAATGWMRGE